MKLKVIETTETIWELPDNYFDDYDYDEEDISDDEIASHYVTGKRLHEECITVEISYDTRVYNYDTRCYEEVGDENNN